MSGQESLEKYVLACFQRAVHIVVQSRCANGPNKRATAKDLNTYPSSGNDIFDINLGKLKQFEHYQITKKLWQKLANNAFLGIQVNVQNARTAASVEIWKFHLDRNRSQPGQNFTETYLRMANLLKSLLVISRLSPCYQYAKEFNFDTFLSYTIEPCYDLTNSTPLGKLACSVGELTFAYEFHIDDPLVITQGSPDFDAPHFDESSIYDDGPREPPKAMPPTGLGQPPASQPVGIASPHRIAPPYGGYTPQHPFSPGSAPFPNSFQIPIPSALGHSGMRGQPRSFQPSPLGAFQPRHGGSPGMPHASSLPISPIAMPPQRHSRQSSTEGDGHAIYQPQPGFPNPMSGDELAKSISKFVRPETRERVAREMASSGLAYSPNSIKSGSYDPHATSTAGHPSGYAQGPHSTTSSEMSQSVVSQTNLRDILRMGEQLKENIDTMVRQPTTVKNEFLEMLEHTDDLQDEKEMFLHFAQNL